MEFDGVVIEAEQPANVTDPNVVAGRMPFGGYALARSQFKYKSSGFEDRCVPREAR